ncbi:MAG: 4Fe-4S dicluster domain-containing protein [Thermodesulfobacteriota bacterium]|nr:4Fe-4S dicluster domain-containing protein [Thermodesulfobacteriota bacterium]
MKTTKQNVYELKNLRAPIILLLSFWAIAIILWQTKGNIFYLFNFGYIGTAVGIGIGLYVVLPKKKKPSGRRLAQLLIGIYMLGFLGIIKMENMQLEGFFFYLLSGFFAGSVIHYLVAKILGPVLFGRGFCGWACWTAMVLDFLPYKRNKAGRIAAKWEVLRYVHFALSFVLVAVLWFVFQYRSIPMGQAELVWLVGGNAFYFTAAIVLALTLKDNRAFCKYLCPITAILKITSRFAFIKIKGDKEKCTQCGACSKACPMDINIMTYVNNGERVLSTECIFCLTCTTVCPEGILDDTFKIDFGGKEYIRRR